MSANLPALDVADPGVLPQLPQSAWTTWTTSWARSYFSSRDGSVMP